MSEIIVPSQDEILEVAQDLCPLYEEYKSCADCDALIDIGDEPCLYKCMAQLMLSKNYRKQEWISVDERLPDPFHTVLVYDMHTECVRISLYKGTDEVWRNGRISHWMPFPEPPKIGGGE